MYNEKGEWIESKDSTRLLLLEKGIILDSTRKKGTAHMLVKDGEDLGYYTASNAHKKFLS